MNALRNIELKARCNDLPAALEKLKPLCPRDTGQQRQIDTYFFVPNGRLKLREIIGVKSELIWYDRSNEAKTRKSDYRLTPVSHPQELKASLHSALGTRGVVDKQRHVLFWHNVRIHLDTVQSLGTFVEFEAVITKGEDEPTGHARLKQLCDLLAIQIDDYLDRSYADLMGFE